MDHLPGAYTGSPDQLLAQSSWRHRNSVWILGVAAGMGLLSFIAYVVVAARVKSQRFKQAAVLSVAACVASFAAMEVFPEKESGFDGSWIAIALWVGQIVYAFALNREYLTWRAHHESAGQVNAYPQYQPNLPPYRAPRAAPPAFTSTDAALPNLPLVPINHATVTDLAVTGLGEEIASRILTARDANGGFGSLDEVTARLSLQPHELNLLRASVTFDA